MSDPAPAVNPRNAAFLAALSKRSLTIETLADMIFSSRSHVNQVLRGSRKGIRTWNKLARVLSVEEMALAVAFANSHLKSIGCRVQPKAQVGEESPQYEVVPIPGSNVPHRTNPAFAAHA